MIVQVRIHVALKGLLPVTDVSTTQAEVIIRVKIVAQVAKISVTNNPGQTIVFFRTTFKTICYILQLSYDFTS